jgi:hypothetical protein
MQEIVYLVPDYGTPSWGVGLLYHHVGMLLEHGFRAAVLHRRAPFRVSWLDVDVPIRYLESSAGVEFRDIAVVPEVLAHDGVSRRLGCRKVVFVQNGFSIFAGSDAAVDYPALGYEAALVTMPHLADVVTRHCGLRPSVVPPFVAPYFFTDEANLQAPRRREVLIFKKAPYGEAGHPDYDIAVKLLRRHFARRAEPSAADGWRIIELEGRTHREAADVMKRAAIFVNVNTLEGFNVTVAEAMAAGCLVVCYEAHGGRDYLRWGENAFVFPNNDIFALVDKVIELAGTLETRPEALESIRRRALATARGYDWRRTAEAVCDVFRGLL